MKQFLKLTGCLAVAGLFASCQSAQQEADYQIIPLPQEIVTAQGGAFILKSGVKILYPEGNEKMQRNAKFLADYLKTATGKDFAMKPEQKVRTLLYWHWERKPKIPNPTS